jgi:UDP-N-acetylmuramoyl-L-alanyl-D-glutamate--2,6-diaminopimelate ligase
MRLDEVIAVGDGELRGAQIQAAAVEITSLAYDSRAVRPGGLFFCVVGLQSDGHDFAAQAIERGAVALVVERPLDLGVSEVVVPSARAAMGPAAVRFYGDPSAELRVVGVTGTNGKTTTAFLLKALLEVDSGISASGASRAAGATCGLLGTVKTVIGGAERPAGRTTPEAIDLQADFRAMLDGGDGACAMEVSSHALELGRADGINFAAAIFTNLTQDHLDFHDTMEDYFQAKRRLFAADPGVSVVNVGDPYGRRLAGELDRVVTFAVEEGERNGIDKNRSGEIADADYRATDLLCDSAGCRFVLHVPGSTPREVALPMPGRFNVANVLGALATTHTLGADLDTLIAALEQGVRVPGRFEPVKAGQGFAVIVDYAHTPDSLENVLRAARDIARGRVICVFGAGGDRDRGKRPLMGKIAARLADVTLVTSDNPRSEAPEAIISEIVAPLARAGTPIGDRQAPYIEVDRRRAIERAIALAEADDVVVIAGKGHEQGQEFENGRKLPFDDITVAREILRARIAAVGAST